MPGKRDYKTWKRETTGALTIWLVLLASYTAYVGTDEIRLSVLGLFALPVLGLLGGMLGLDAIQKQELKKQEFTQDLKDDAETDRVVQASDTDTEGNK